MSENFDWFFEDLDEIVDNGLFRKEDKMSKLLNYFIEQPECIEDEFNYTIKTKNKDMWFTLDRQEMQIYMWVGIDYTPLTFEEFKQFEELIDKEWK